MTTIGMHYDVKPGKEEEFEQGFLKTLDLYGPDNAMWSSDYPHTAATWPQSQEFINKTFSGLPEETRRNIVHDTAARVYGIEQ